MYAKKNWEGKGGAVVSLFLEYSRLKSPNEAWTVVLRSELYLDSSIFHSFFDLSLVACFTHVVFVNVKIILIEYFPLMPRNISVVLYVKYKTNKEKHLNAPTGP